ncbi:signal-induced proliferation-associated protein 1 isoform X2 [Dermochelys coriacea]|uniref:signal-induced proliferation-associated protein 1 isoform X2 n=1 Tax=Dermochelys coriacea TaxID=27794 RepID=UPI0018E8210D|nr:signal-induced proliferation-associated protein 1 isoform X2 [Dermochelys coriacea]
MLVRGRAMQSDDLFIRKIRRHSTRSPLASIFFDAKGLPAPLLRPPWSEVTQGLPRGHGNPPGLTLRPASHIMHRSNSDVILGEGVPGDGAPASSSLVGGGDCGLHRDYGSLSSIEKGSGPPRTRAHSHEEPRAGSPAARRFCDPLLLLGLPGNEMCDGDGQGAGAAVSEQDRGEEPPKFPQQVWVRQLAHYDVQSILFDPGEAAWCQGSAGRRVRNITTGASAASTGPAPTPVPEEPDPGDGKDGPLVLSCPHFRNEIGGEEERGLGRRQETGEGAGQLPNAAVSVLEEPRESYPTRGSRATHCIEYADLGASYYRKYFYGKEHQNFFGVDERLGAVAVSLRREEKEKEGASLQYSYRLILRTSELRTLRGSVLEEALPPTARPPTARGLSPKKLLEHVLPDLNLQRLRLASNSPKVPEILLKLDEQGVSFQRKVGVLYCRAGQGSEEEMYNNEGAGPHFQEFLELLGQHVQLRGFTKYRAQLDTKTDSTGTHSLYTMYQDYEIMFHVSTMLPYTPNNRQQLLRKRHIGNDIVTIIFQEPGAQPFTPRTIRSHFQHVFIIVRAHEPCTERTTYSVAVSRTKDIPLFGPPIPAGHHFPRTPAFRDFLLAKAINAENAAERSGKFHAMATRTRQEYLQDLACSHTTTTSLEASSSRLPLLSLGAKRKERAKGAKACELQSAGALVWSVRAKDGDRAALELPSLLGISAEFLVLIEAKGKRVIFNCSCRDVLAWTYSDCGLDLYYGSGDYISVRLPDGQGDEVKDIVHRLQLVTRGCETRELTLLRNGLGQLGFQVDSKGFVTDVERFTFAEKAGLHPGARLVRVCEQALPSLSHAQTTELLRTAKKVTITMVPPDENGKPRRSFSELYVKALQEKRRSHSPAREPPRPAGDPGPEGELRPGTLQLLRSLSLQDGPPHSLAEERTEFLRSHSEGTAPPKLMTQSREIPMLSDPTPDLILAATPKGPPEPDMDHPGDPTSLEQAPPDHGVMGSQAPAPSETVPPTSDMSDTEKFLPRTLSLRNSITKILSEASESLEEEWDSISNLATTCNSILEALSKEGQHVLENREPPGGSGQRNPGQQPPEDEGHQSRSLSEKVSHLESMLKKLQEDLQQEQAAKAALQAEVQCLRQNNQRLQQEQESAAARLSQVTRLLCGSPGQSL